MKSKVPRSKTYIFKLLLTVQCKVQKALRRIYDLNFLVISQFPRLINIFEAHEGVSSPSCH